MRPGLSARAVAAVLILIFGSGGCGQRAGVLFEPLPEALVWPAPPAPGRIEYVGQLVTSEDLKPGKSFGQALGEALFGGGSIQSMLTPFAVCTDAGERVFVADTNAQVVHVFDLESREYEQWRPEDAAFAQPVGIAWGAGQRLLVADSVAARIFVFARDGAFLGHFGADLLERPGGLAVDPATGRVFVTDAGAHQVLVFDPDGLLLQRVGARGTEPGRFNFPTNVAVDDAGRLYVADTLNFRVQVFDRELQPLRVIGSHGDMPGYFSQPKGLAIDSDGHLYVVDAHFENVQIFDRGGELLLDFGREGHGEGEFWLPAGINIDPSDRIWVADSYNRRVQVFQYLRESE